MLHDPRQDQTSRDLLKAAEIIKRDGWIRKMMWYPPGHPNRGVCAKGALIIAITGERAAGLWDDHAQRYIDAQTALVNHLGLKLGSSGLVDCMGLPSMSEVSTWNDFARDKEEIIDGLCAAAGVTADVLT